jgi:tetratricopeptide (TPR) repeat protein
MKNILYLIILFVFIISCNDDGNKQAKYQLLIEEGSESFSNQNFNDAIVDFSKAITINDKNPNAHYRLGVTYAALADSNRVNLKKALNSFEIVQKIDKDYERLNYNVGICFMIKEDYINALSFFKDAEKKDSLDVDILLNKAICSFIIKDSASGCTDLRRAKFLGDKEAPELIKKYCTNYN